MSLKRANGVDIPGEKPGSAAASAAAPDGNMPSGTMESEMGSIAGGGDEMPNGAMNAMESGSSEDMPGMNGTFLGGMQTGEMPSGSMNATETGGFGEMPGTNGHVTPDLETSEMPRGAMGDTAAAGAGGSIEIPGQWRLTLSRI